MPFDGIPDPEDAFAVWDSQTNDYYTASDGTVRTFSREEDAEQFLTGLEPQEVNADRLEEPAQETAGAAPAAEEPGLFTRDPLASAYGVGDFVFLEDTEYRITDLQRGYVQLNDPALAYPVCGLSGIGYGNGSLQKPVWIYPGGVSRDRGITRLLQRHGLPYPKGAF